MADAFWDFGTASEYPVLKVDFDGNGTATYQEFGNQRLLGAPVISSVRSANQQLIVEWTAPAMSGASAITGYDVRYILSSADETDDANWTVLEDVWASGRSLEYTITGLTNGSTYDVQVRAKNEEGVGLWSETMIGTPAMLVDYDIDDDGLIAVSTLEQLNAIRYDLDGDGAVDDANNANAYALAFPNPVDGMGCLISVCTGYELTTDLDFENASSYALEVLKTAWTTGAGWEPIGTSTDPFTATFHGGGHSISNLFIDRSSGEAGLFGYSSGTLQNVGLGSVDMRGSGFAGGLVSKTTGTVSAAYVTGQVESGSGYAGGLVGKNEGVIHTSYSWANVVNTRNGGGLVGQNAGTLSACYAAGTVSTSRNAGGLVGWNEASGSVHQCYAIGHISSNASDRVGGFFGELTAPRQSTTFSASYWDNVATGHNNGVGSRTASVFPASGIAGKPTSELQSPTGYTGIYETWDDVDVTEDDVADAFWDFGTARGYPVLKVDFDGDDTATYQEFGNQRVISAPTIFSVRLAPEQLIVEWTAPIHRGAFPLTGYDVRYILSSADERVDANWTVLEDVWASGSSLEYAITGLTSGSTYDVQVRAKNQESVGPWSATVVGVPGVDYDIDDDGLIAVSTLEQLDAIRYNLNGDSVVDDARNADAYALAFPNPVDGMGCPESVCAGYELTTDLDFENASSYALGEVSTAWTTGNGWEPIGTSTDPFTATFHGMGHSISNLRVSRPSNWIGLFGYSSGTLQNVGLVNVYIGGRGEWVGGLVGVNTGMVSATYVTGRVVSGRGVNYIGGLAGQNGSAGVIRTSYSWVTVRGDHGGGLVGQNAGTLSACYATGWVDNRRSAGGLVGWNDASGSVHQCYAIGRVSSDESNVVGGFFGTMIRPNNSTTFSASYWDIVATGRNNGVGSAYASQLPSRIAGKPTSELQSPTGYTGIYETWNDEDVTEDNVADAFWDFGTVSEHPVLKVDFDGDDTATYQEFGNQRLLGAPAISSVTPANQQLIVEWTVPIHRGTTPTGYDVRYIFSSANETVDANWTVLEDVWASGSSLEYAIMGLTLGVNYDVQVRAKNEEGVGPWSATVAGVPGVDYDIDDNGLIEVSILEQLNAIRYDLNGDGAVDDANNRQSYTLAFPDAADGMGCPESVCAGYELTTDLDFKNAESYASREVSTAWTTGNGWEPIGTSTAPFTATFHGGGYSISNLRVLRPSNWIGLFGYSSGTLQNVGLVNVYIGGRGQWVGGLVGVNTGVVSATYVAGGRVVSGRGVNYIGGLAGQNGGAGVIRTSYSWVTVRGDHGGGLVGQNAGTLSACYATGWVDNRRSAGGLVGWNDASGSVHQCYAIGRVSSDESNVVGGFFGTMIRPNNSTTFSASYWDIVATGRNNGVGSAYASQLPSRIAGKPTSELQSPTGYTGIYETWDDEDVTEDNVADAFWDFRTASEYPVLKVDFDGNGTATYQEFGNQRLLGAPAISSVTPANQQLIVEWTIPANRGISSVTGYDLRYILSSADEMVDANWTVLEDVWMSGRSLEYTITGLTTGSTYDVQVRAKNEEGVGPWSATVVGTPAILVDYDIDDDGLIAVSTLEQLNAIRHDLDGDGAVEDARNANAYASAFPDAAYRMGCPESGCAGYELTTDLDFENAESYASRVLKTAWTTGAGWKPIGRFNYASESRHPIPFAATFDGMGHIIFNLFIDRTGSEVGLFAFSSGTLQNVGLESVDVRGSGFAGGLVGTNTGVVSAAYVTGHVESSSGYAGGLAGQNEDTGVIRTSYSWVTVRGNLGGGLVGQNAGTLSACYAAGIVSTSSNAGGLVSWNEASGSVKQCLAIGRVSGSASDRVGGFFGAMSIPNSSARFSASYWDNVATGHNNGVGAFDISRLPSSISGKPTSELQSPTGYTGIYETWDDVDVTADGVADAFWDFGTVSEYPVLKVDFNGDGSTTYEEFGNQRFLSAPTISSVRSANQQVIVEWTMPAMSGASAITGYDVRYILSSADEMVDANWTVLEDVWASGSSLEYAMMGLIPGVNYGVQVRAKNEEGRGPWSATVTWVDYDIDDNGLIEVSTLEQLDAIRYDLNGNGRTAEAHKEDYALAFPNPVDGMGCPESGCTGYELTADMNFSNTRWSTGSGWEPIGTESNPFSAAFHGGGHAISNLYIRRSNNENVGLFGVSSGTFQNVGLINVDVSGGSYVGGLVGQINTDGEVSVSYVRGTVSATGTAGGLAGHNEGTIRMSYARVGVINTLNGGGLVGQNAGTLLACYATGIVNTTRNAGGLVGWNLSSGSVVNCYTISRVLSSASDRVGGFFGGLSRPSSSARFSANYWDRGITGHDNGGGSRAASVFPASGIEGQATSELISVTGYTDIYTTWDDEDVTGDGGADSPWDLRTASEFPVLKVDFNGDNYINWQEFGNQPAGSIPEDVTPIWVDFLLAKENGTEPILPDFSYAGYHYSNKPVPDVNTLGYTTFNVTNYGAVANDNVSDQSAIQAAIDAAEANGSGIVFFPPGEFLVNTNADITAEGDYWSITVQSSNIVLRGSGSRREGTIIRQVNDMPGDPPSDLESPPFMFVVKPVGSSSTLTSITEDAARETFWITVADASMLEVGQWIDLRMRSTEAVSDFLHPYSRKSEWTVLQDIGIIVAEKHSIAEIDGNRVRLNEPLHVLKIEADHGWTVHEYPVLEEVGIEDISFQGSWFDRFEHHLDARHDSGWSLLKLKNCVNSWIRRVSFINFSRIKIESCAAVSVYHITIAGTLSHYFAKNQGNYGVWFGLIEDLSGQLHGPNAMSATTGTVYYRFDMKRNQSMDFHSWFPYANLYDKIKGGRLTGSGGAKHSMPNHLRHLVFWNLYHRHNGSAYFNLWAGDSYGLQFVKPIIVGLHGDRTSFDEDQLEVLESNGSEVEPESLFEAQLELRLGSVPSWLNNLRTEWETLRSQSLTIPTRD